MEIVGAPQRWTIEANWKLAADNFVSDAYHTGFTHGSVVELGLAAKPQFAKFGYQITAGNGHGLGLGSGVPGSPPILPEECIGEYRKNLTPEQFDTLVNLRNLHANVFPNFSLLIPTVKVEGQMVSVLTLRLWVPSGPNKMEIYSWFMVEKNATEDFKRKSHKGYTLTFGSSGIFEQDDTENWFEITENSRKMLKVVDFFFNAEMGVDRKPVEDGQFPGPGEAIYEGKYNEANSRAFYRQWRKLLLSV
jgi:phenylpropionate dioxygenase-like ring-hydroxylating dioxygenase large terminal subunit